MNQQNENIIEPERELIEELLELSKRLVLETGQMVAELRPQTIDAFETKSSPTDPVTAADREAEKKIIQALAKARPDDSIVGEEGAAVAGSSPLTWYIDPIDGTTNFLYGLPYCVSIAASWEQTVIAGAVYDPTKDELFSAGAGRGAKLNGSDISVTQNDHVPTALVATGFSYKSELRNLQGQALARILPQIRDIRRSGSAALDLCALAAGRVDAYYEHCLNIWDYAAGFLIATEAGAKGELIRHDMNLIGTDNELLAASSPQLYKLFKEVLLTGFKNG